MRYVLLLPVLALMLFAAGCGTTGEPTRTTNSSTDPTATTAPASGSPAAGSGSPEATSTTGAPAPAATSTPEATAIPAATPPDVQVMQWKQTPTSYGGVYVMGYVQNLGETAAQDVQVVISLRDATGNIVGSTNAFVPDVITAGAQAPFHASISQVDPANIASVDLVTQFETFEADGFAADFWYTDLDVSQANWTDAGWSGEVTNVGEQSAKAVSVHLCALNADGTIIWCNSGYADLEELAPGAGSPYSINIYEDGLPTPASMITYAIGHAV